MQLCVVLHATKVCVTVPTTANAAMDIRELYVEQEVLITACMHVFLLYTINNNNNVNININIYI